MSQVVSALQFNSQKQNEAVTVFFQLRWLLNNHDEKQISKSDVVAFTLWKLRQEVFKFQANHYIVEI